MESGRKDITDRTDVKLFVDRFYNKVTADPLLAPVFTHVNWEHHLPIMYNFWASMLLGEQTYRGNPLQNHLALNVTSEHFKRWLKFFTETIDENFQGEKAEEVKMRANSIAGIFQVKMGLMK
jgi:hemoglobin